MKLCNNCVQSMAVLVDVTRFLKRLVTIFISIGDKIFVTIEILLLLMSFTKPKMKMTINPIFMASTVQQIDRSIWTLENRPWKTQIHSHHILQIPVPKNTNALFVKVSHHFRFGFAHFRCEILSSRAIFNSYFQ